MHFKMSFLLFNIFIDSNDNDHVTTILTCLDANPRFFLELIFKNSKNVLQTLKLYLVFLVIFMKSN